MQVLCIPSKMETFIILRSKTDDALELFVKAHVMFQMKTKKLETLEKCHARVVWKHDRMCRKSTTARKLETIFEKMSKYEREIDALYSDIIRLEDECEHTGNLLINARKDERDYLATIVKNEIVA